MKRIVLPHSIMLFLFLAIILQFSCSKDTDLLAEYVVYEDPLSIDDIVLLQRGGNGPDPNASRTADDDGDGILNEMDDCPYTSVGAKVNNMGCADNQYDTDGDGVSDDMDQCSGTEASAEVDENGCPLDSVNTESDNENTGSGSDNNQPDSQGTADEDSDGVPNSVDECPNTAIGASVNSFGCSASQYDTDSDGITDNMDQCPNTPNGQSVSGNGCPESNTSKNQGPLAFPSAQGFGRYASGGRGKPIYVVTNLNNDGPGSFRRAVEDAEDNNGGTIVFKTGGTINLLSPISIGNDRSGNITIAGETAPGDGITLRMDSRATYGATLEIRGSNVIVRYLRSYVGSTAHSSCDNVRIHTAGSAQEPSQNATLEDIIIDHLSLYWNTDEAIEIGAYHGGTIRNVTVQNCLVGEPLESGYGPLVYRSHEQGETTSVYNVSFYANMFNDVNDRHPAGTASGLSYEVINNVHYNCRSTTKVTYGSRVDFIGCVRKNNNNVQPSTQFNRYVYRYAPNTNGTPYESWVTPDQGTVWEEDTFIIGDNTGNTLYNQEWITHNNKSRIHTVSPINPLPSSEVSNLVALNVGSNIHRDAHDTRLIDNFLNNTGWHVTNESEVGGHLTYDEGTPYDDVDGDYMWDVAEIALWGNITTTDNPQADLDGDGYTNIEETFFYFTGE